MCDKKKNITAKTFILYDGIRTSHWHKCSSADVASTVNSFVWHLSVSLHVLLYHQNGVQHNQHQNDKLSCCWWNKNKDCDFFKTPTPYKNNSKKEGSEFFTFQYFSVLQDVWQACFSLRSLCLPLPFCSWTYRNWNFFISLGGSKNTLQKQFPVVWSPLKLIYLRIQKYIVTAALCCLMMTEQYVIQRLILLAVWIYR